MTSRPSSMNEIAAAEMTALAAGAGPPENTIATRRMWSPLRAGGAGVVADISAAAYSGPGSRQHTVDRGNAPPQQQHTVAAAHPTRTRERRPAHPAAMAAMACCRARHAPRLGAG